ncbi:MAG TPA: hypothetical protein PKK10_17920 [Woeseiaceae bacterium]|nr:hypothetical protein [Woeseiaceae bacterium]
MGIAELWMPILVSSIIVFVMSALVWMVLPWHKSDFKKAANEDALRAALKGAGVGYYMLPYCTSTAELKDEALAQKYVEGPQAFITVVPNGMPKMGAKLLLSFFYYVGVGILCAYMLSRTIVADAPYLEIFRVVGTTAFIAHGVAFVQDSIWFGRPWSLTTKNLLDALIYGALTGGTFGWLAQA